VDDLTYFVNGLGGRSSYSFPNVLPESIVRYNDDYGAMLLKASETELICKFINVEGDLIDSCKITFPVNTSVLENVNNLNTFSLEQNYPNPFNTSTRIDFSIPREQFVKINVYNMLGEQVAKLVNGIKEAGSYSVIFDASNLPSGFYIYELSNPDVRVSQKLLLLK